MKLKLNVSRLFSGFIILIFISQTIIGAETGSVDDLGPATQSSSFKITPEQVMQQVPEINNIQSAAPATQTSNGFNIPQVNKLSTSSQSVSSATGVLINKKGETIKIDSAAQIKTIDLEAYGLSNADLERGTMENALQITDKSGFTLQNAQNAQVQVLHQTADIETPEGDYYLNRELVITTADYAGINTPGKLLAFDVEKVYSTNDVLTFDRARNLLLKNPPLSINNPGQTIVFFDRGNPNMTREVRTVSQDKTLTMPNPLSSPSSFKIWQPQPFEVSVIDNSSQPRKFNSISDLSQFLAESTPNFMKDGTNMIVQQLKSLKREVPHGPLFQLTKEGYNTCNDCVLSFIGNGETKGKQIILTLDKIKDGKFSLEIPAGMNITFGNNAPNVENPENTLTIQALNESNTSLITITKEPNGNTIIEATNAEINRDYGL